MNFEKRRLARCTLTGFADFALSKDPQKKVQFHVTSERLTSKHIQEQPLKRIDMDETERTCSSCLFSTCSFPISMLPFCLFLSSLFVSFGLHCPLMKRRKVHKHKHKHKHKKHKWRHQQPSTTLNGVLLAHSMISLQSNNHSSCLARQQHQQSDQPIQSVLRLYFCSLSWTTLTMYLSPPRFRLKYFCQSGYGCSLLFFQANVCELDQKQ